MIQSIESGRKEDGNRSIADKIIKRLHDLEMTVDNNQGRWAWELLQNAKDSVAESNRRVSVEIEIDETRVVFKHNGLHFSEKDIRGLINQISSKEVEEGQESKQTGKFGTGFLTTHLLSKVIHIDGIVETIDRDFYQFSFPLDRRGKTTGQLVGKIEEAWSSFHDSTSGSQIENYDEEKFNTSFLFNLETEQQREVAKIGIGEFTQLVPFVLAFIPEIESVTIVDNINHSTILFENSEEVENDVLLRIFKTENNEKSQINLLFAQEDDVAIAALVEGTEKGYLIRSLQNFPKLFCDFPLIGTEDFHFPVIVNSFYFNPLMERDGVWLKGDGKEEVEENRVILKKAVQLYGQLLEKITELNYYDYYNICISKTPKTNENHFDSEWYKKNIQKPLREKIKKNKVVELVSGEKYCIETKDSWVDIPHAESKIDREAIWRLCNIDSYFILPKFEHIHIWHELIWDSQFYCAEEMILKFAEEYNDIKDLQDAIGDFNVFEWLNNLFEFIVNHQNNYKLFNKYAVIPNQEGDFKKLKELSTDEIEDENLKEICSLLGFNFFEGLIHKDIFFEDTHNKKTIQDVAIEISNRINNDDPTDENRIFAIRRLSEWFENNPEKGRTYFEALYRRKEKLFVDTIQDKENLYRVLKSKTPMSKMAEIAKAIEDDPEILNIISKRKREREEEIERNQVGEQIEKVLGDVLKMHGFEVVKEKFGKDLVVSLKNERKTYSIEVKSTSRESFVSMTPNQATLAVNESDNYALCVVKKNGSKVDEEYIKNNAKFVVDIGKRLYGKVNEVNDFQSVKSEIAFEKGEIGLLYENELEYKFKISSNIWTKGFCFNEFIQYLMSTNLVRQQRHF